MTSELTVGNFKRIIEPITFKELSTVNYFVGKNGSGKSSALNALTYLGDPRDASNSRHFFNADSVVQFSIDALGSKKTNKLSWNEENPNKVDSVLSKRPFPYIIIPWIVIVYDALSLYLREFQEL